MSIDPLLQLLRSSGRLPVTELAERLSLPEDEVRARLGGLGEGWDDSWLSGGGQPGVDGRSEGLGIH